MSHCTLNWNRHAHPLWSTVLIHLGKCFPLTLLFCQSFTKDVHWYWERSDESIADVLVLRWNIPHQKIWLSVSLPMDFWDPLDTIWLPASWAAMDKSLHKFVHPLHDSEFLLVISSLKEGGLYIFGQHANLTAGYICPHKYSHISSFERVLPKGENDCWLSSLMT